MIKSMTNANIMKAATQVKGILKQLPKEKTEKINSNFLKFLDNVEDKEYKFEYKNINEQELLPETVTMLQIIYKNYWCTPEEAQIIENKMIENQKEYEKELKQKYDVNNIFKTLKTSSQEQIDTNLPTVYKENIFTKILNYIYNIFKGRKR